MAIDTARFREELLQERQRVLDAIENLRDDHPGSLEDETQEIPSDNHLGDVATEVVEREIDYTLGENSENVLQAIERALTKIEDGGFGTCESCGRPIAEDRLAAIPWATRCIDCQRREEHG
jgi:RNA polymerase-binding protein DksA